MPIAAGLRAATARRPSARARRRSSARCWSRPTAARSRSAAAASSPSGSARRSAATSSSGWRSTPSEAWRRIARQRPAAGDQRRGRRSAARRAPAALRGAGRRDRAAGRPRRGRAARCRRSRRWPSCPRDEAALGGQRLGRVPGLRRPRPARARTGGRCEGRRFCVTDSDGRRRSTPIASSRWRSRSRSTPARSAKTMAEAERVLRELAAPG